MVRVTEDVFGIAVNPMNQTTERVRRFTIATDAGLSVSILTLGAIIQSVKVADRNKKIDDICLGFDDVAGYYRNQPCYMGATIGRVANRISKRGFTLCGKPIQVTRNYNDEYHLNGGFIGFDSVIWDVIGVHKDGVTLQHISPDGHEGYPGEVTVNVNFSLSESGCLGIRYEARSSATTCINITNHAYFNLAGHGAGKSALQQHMIMIKSERIVDTDAVQIPNGRLLPIANTPYDLKNLSNLGKQIARLQECPIGGFDNTYCTNAAANRVTLVARAIHPCSGRYLEVHTNQPSVHFYTANNLPDESDAPVIGKEGAQYVKHGSFCFETQKYPDAMNNPSFPSVVLNPGELYDHQVVFRFGACPGKPI